MRTIGWMLFFAAVAGLDALRDAGFSHEHWLRAPFLWTDYWHFVKWGAFYGPLVVVLYKVWPLWQRVTVPPDPRVYGRVWQYHNAPRWLAAAVVGWASWWIFVRVGGAPWLK